MPRVCIALVCFLCAVYASSPESSQSPLEHLIASNARVLQLKNGSLTGPGADFLLTETAGVQFVVLGEEHNTREIPEFTTALFRTLQERYGFRFLATEQDPVTMRWISEAPARGRRESIVAIAQRYPHALTFVSDQEIAMLADIGIISKTAARPVWGCDQAFGATHILDRLLAINSSSAAAESLRNVRDAISEKERTRDIGKYHYMAQEAKSELFAKLRDIVRPKTGSEAEYLVESLIVSDRIYRNYREGAYYENAREREHYMKTRFLEEYRQAQTVEKATPKVILKFGHWHLYRGFSPNHQQTIGNFVSEFAVANGSRSFHLAIFPNNGPGEYGDLAKWRDQSLSLIARNLKTTEWTIVDLRPLRSQYSRLGKDMPADLKDSFRRMIFGYDAALFVGGMRRGTYNSTPGVEF